MATAPVHRMRRRRLRSELLGDLIVEEDAILEFPDGLFGFASCKEWVLVGAGRPGWCWLHAVDHAALAFLLVDPFDAVPEFSVALTPQDLAALDAQSATEVGVFAIVTLPRTAADVMTVNLQGPVAIVASSRRGRQLVIGDARASDPRFGARAPLSASFDATVEAGAQVLRERTDTES
ncbi:MAG: flagellar assembly protein FliW [Gemmatimonadetes bacterium]|nr:flagellar assembly protein FliW [Gemmatimonadota bacterium]